MSKFNFKTNKWDSSHEEWKSFGHISFDPAKSGSDETVISLFKSGNILPMISINAKSSEVTCHKENYTADEVILIMGMALGNSQILEKSLANKSK